ncbi:hypothetical protein V8E54_008828 [Elaphomyces granulatus]
MLFPTLLGLLYLHKVTAQITQITAPQGPQPTAAYAAMLKAGLATGSCDPSVSCTTCQGMNNYPNSTTDTGICQSGPCHGKMCASACPSDPVSCRDANCAGAANPLNSSIGRCLGGDYNGCDCLPQCPGSLIYCDTCNGTSSSHGEGECGPGDYFGCSCRSTCGTYVDSCSANECNGINSGNTTAVSQGICTTDKYAGCDCTSTCSGMDSCSANECNGINSPDGKPGFCTFDRYWGCPCTSTCGIGDSNTGQCDSPDCLGVNMPRDNNGNVQYGSCTAGKYWGCLCKSICGPSHGACSDPGCGGFNAPDGGLGVCIKDQGKYLGCLCNSNCNGAPSCGGCDGLNGICTSGAFAGCNCPAG